MNDKSNFYVFEKKEVLLVILFVILVSVTSFLFGLKIGSSYSFESSGNSSSEQALLGEEGSKSVEFISKEEERVKELVNESEARDEKSINEEIQESLKSKIMNEFSDQNKKFLDQGSGTQDSPKTEVVENVIENNSVQSQDTAIEPTTNTDSEMLRDSKKKNDSFSGKYTIQLGSYRTISEAKEFAEGFKVLGYSPVINEVEITGRGNWFRVSLGVFDNLATAKEYILQNKSLFAERDYVFIQFD